MCEELWDSDSELYVDPLKPKGLTADPHVAYGLLGFMGVKNAAGNPVKLVLSGKFPKAQYMSLQIYRGWPIQTNVKVGAELSDFRIKPKTGKNRFATLNPNDTGTFEIEITPDPAQGPNRIWYEPRDQPGPSAAITAFYRIYQPETEIRFSDLPKIEAFDMETNAPTDCPTPVTLPWYIRLPFVEAAAEFAIQEQNPILFKDNNDTIFGENPPIGGSGDIVYQHSFSKVPRGKVVVIKFRAPAINFGAPQVPGRFVRYWSFCSVYELQLKTLNGVASAPQNPEERDVTVVFGPDDQEIRSMANALNAEFLPDTREPGQNTVMFILRNLLPTDDFKPFEGPYAPKANVLSRSDFMSLLV